MSGREDTGSNSVADAASFERWRSAFYGEDLDGLRARSSRRVPARLDGCRCHGRSLTPCDFCSAPNDHEPTTRTS